jgi:hypothetical protein
MPARPAQQQPLSPRRQRPFVRPPRRACKPPPPTATAPRILRKPPLPELERIAKSYNLDLSRDDLTSFRNLMDGVLASYRRLDLSLSET